MQPLLLCLLTTISVVQAANSITQASPNNIRTIYNGGTPVETVEIPPAPTQAPPTFGDPATLEPFISTSLDAGAANGGEMTAPTVAMTTAATGDAMDPGSTVASSTEAGPAETAAASATATSTSMTAIETASGSASMSSGSTSSVSMTSASMTSTMSSAMSSASSKPAVTGNSAEVVRGNILMLGVAAAGLMFV